MPIGLQPIYSPQPSKCYSLYSSRPDISRPLPLGLYIWRDICCMSCIIFGSAVRLLQSTTPIFSHFHFFWIRGPPKAEISLSAETDRKSKGPKTFGQNRMSMHRKCLLPREKSNTPSGIKWTYETRKGPWALRMLFLFLLLWYLREFLKIFFQWATDRN